jgi:hypothetical protein
MPAFGLRYCVSCAAILPAGCLARYRSAALRNAAYGCVLAVSDDVWKISAVK